MKKYLANGVPGIALIAAVGLSGCAVDPTYANVSAKSSVDAEADVLTGSRLARPTTERLLKQVGNKDYKDEQIKSIHNDAKPSN